MVTRLSLMIMFVKCGFVIAATFMEEFRSDHQDQFSREINSLISLSYPQDLEKNELAKRFREFKVDIEVSTDIYFATVCDIFQLAFKLLSPAFDFISARK